MNEISIFLFLKLINIFICGFSTRVTSAFLLFFNLFRKAIFVYFVWKCCSFFIMQILSKVRRGEGRLATTISLLSHILLIFSSEPPRTFSSFINLFLKSPILEVEINFRKHGHGLVRLRHCYDSIVFDIINKQKN